MAKKKFLLVSLQEEQSKKLAQVISNSTCRKILDVMSDKDNMTETEVAHSLKISPSTVHYNLQQLKKAELIESEDFHYSEKGREVRHWRLANKYIIIAPGKTWGIKEKLKHILPVIGIAGGVALAMQLIGGGPYGVSKLAVSSYQMQREVAAPMAAPALAEPFDEGIEELGKEAADSDLLPAAADVAVDSEVLPLAAEAVEALAAPSQAAMATPNIALWFFIGAVVAVALYLFFDYLRYRK